jgi:hypothetical protein
VSAAGGAPGVGSALGQAFGMVRRAGGAILGAYLLNLALSAILAATVYGAVQASLGSSLAGARMRAGWDQRWYESFAVQAQGAAATFRPSISGPGGVLDALDAFGDGFAALRAHGPASGVLVVMAAYLAAWSFLSAAFLGTFASRPAAAGFLQRGAVWFPRLLPITLVGLAFYAIVLGPVRGAIDGGLASALHDVSDARLHLAWTAAAYGLLWLVVALGNLVLDYAKAFRVRQEETRARWALARALRGAAGLVLRRPVAIVGLYAATALCGLAALVLYAALAPGAEGGSWAVIASSALLGQLFVLSRIALRGLFLAGATVMASAAATGAGAGSAAAATSADVPKALSA